MSTICFCSCEIHPTTRGGAGVFVHNAARKLLAEQHSVVLLLDIARSDFDRFDRDVRRTWPGSDRCRAYLVEDLCQGSPLAACDAPTPAYRSSLRWAAALSALAAKESLDLVEFYDFAGPAYASLACRAFGRLPSPRVIAVRVHTPLSLIDEVGGTRYLDRDRWSMHALERGAYRRAEAVLVPSPTFYESEIRERYDVEPHRAISSPPTMGDGLRDARGNSRAEPLATPPFTIAFVGRMFQIKGVDQFVHAAVELLRRRPKLDARFDIIGSDSSESPLGDSYVAYVRSLIPLSMRDKFIFPGHVAHDQLGERLKRAVAAVFPSRLESFGYAMHEARAFGLPIIARDIPGVRDFLIDGSDAILYDGETRSLVAAMERVLDEPALREQLSRPSAKHSGSLGSFYQHPQPLRQASEELPISEVTVLLLGSSEKTIDTLRRQTHPPARIVQLRPANTDSDEIAWLLARPWHAVDEHANPIGLAQVLTTGALALLQAGDQPRPEWLALCMRALNHDPSIGFAGTWGSRDGRVISSILDLAPESWVIERANALTRTVVRTVSGRMLIDAVDPSFGMLGDIARVFESIERYGPGVLLPEAHIELSTDSQDPADPNFVKYLIGRYSSVLKHGLADAVGFLYENLLAAQAGAPHPENDPSFAHKVAVADQLGGRTLLRLGWRKMLRRLRGQAPPT